MSLSVRHQSCDAGWTVRVTGDLGFLNIHTRFPSYSGETPAVLDSITAQELNDLVDVLWKFLRWETFSGKVGGGANR